jgi:hydroxymethylpyrimidine/phosphomethylpyrimidine kinase
MRALIRTSTGHVVRALTIAGSDSGGGAGIQADLKTFSAFGVYGTSVLTALTAQNTLGVQGVFYIDAAFVQQQLNSVLDDIGTDAVKTGMLGSRDIIHTVADELARRNVKNLVVDPVMIAKGGQPLIDKDATESVAKELLPLATVVTPNIPEAEVLSGTSIATLRDCQLAAKTLHELGAKYVVVKGGHATEPWVELGDIVDPSKLANTSMDVLYDGNQFTYFVSERIPTNKTHGTGCTFSSAITASLASGDDVLSAVARAKAFIHNAIFSAKDWDVGSGHGPTDHSVQIDTKLAVKAGAIHVYGQGEWNVYGP